MRPRRRCDFPLCRRHYRPDSTLSHHCSDTCRSKYHQRKRGERYLGEPFTDEEADRRAITLSKTAKRLLSYRNPALLLEVNLSQEELDHLQLQLNNTNKQHLQQQQSIRQVQAQIAQLQKNNAAPESLGGKAFLEWQANQSTASLSESLAGAVKVATGYGADFAIKSQNQDRQQAAREEIDRLQKSEQLLLGQLRTCEQDQQLLKQVWEEKYFALLDKVQIINRPEPRQRNRKPKPVAGPQADTFFSPVVSTEAAALVPGRYRSARELMQQPGGEPVVLAEPFRSFLGKLERKDLFITLTGKAGSGKTHFCFQLAKAFCDSGLKVMYYSLETGCDSQLFKDHLTRYHLSGEDRFYAADTASLSDLGEAAGYFDVIFIDSWTKVKEATGKDYGTLCKAFPELILVAIFQQTSGGKIRGGTAPEFDSSINLEVSAGVARNGKNRFEGRGEYTIFPPPQP